MLPTWKKFRGREEDINQKPERAIDAVKSQTRESTARVEEQQRNECTKVFDAKKEIDYEMELNVYKVKEGTVDYGGAFDTIPP